jgi:hypothetical protein
LRNWVGQGKKGERTEEQVLEHDRLLRQSAKVAPASGIRVGDRLALDARPREVDVEEEQENSETDDGWLCDIVALMY